jgi:DNA polymerase-1
MAFTCTNCELCQTKGKNHVQGIGNVKAELLIVGDAPSGRDAVTGVPFSGRDKDVLAALLARLKLTRKDVFTTNLLQCALPTDKKGAYIKATPAQYEACWENLAREINVIRPKVILLLGAGPAAMFLHAKTLGSVAGRIYDSVDARGLTYALSGKTKTVVRGKAKVELKLNKPEQFKVLATYSPGAVLKDPSRLAELERAFDTVGALLSGKTAEKPVYDYKYAYTEPEVFEMLKVVRQRAEVMHVMEPNSALSFDIETSGLNWYKRMFGSGHVAKTISIAFSFKPFEAFGVSLRPHVKTPRNLALLKGILEHPVRKCGHNGKFDNVFLRGELGIRVANFAWDTMVAAYHLDQEALIGLDKLSPIFRPDLGHYWEAISKAWLNKEADGKKKNTEIGYLYAPDPELLEYNCRDVDATQTLYQVQQVSMRAWGAIEPFTQISMPHLHVLADMEYTGVEFDVERCIDMGKAMRKRMTELEVSALALVGRHPHWWDKDCEKYGVAKADYRPFNIGSGKQLGELLFNELGLQSTKKTDKGAASVDADAMDAIKDGHPFVAKLLEYRKMDKHLSTYLGWEVKPDGTEGPMTTGGSLLAVVGADRRIRASFNLTGTGTGRLSCSAPNLQNQPKTKDFRDLFTAKEGWALVDADFAALELRVVAIIANDEAMLDIFRRGIDPHSATASRMFGIPIEQVAKDGKQRKAAKAINFGIVYGKGASSLAADLGVDKSEAEKWLEDWGKSYPGVTRFINAKHAEVRKNGYVSYSMNRRRPLPAIFSEDKGLSGGAERASVNTPVQGTGADCTSMASIRIQARYEREMPGRAYVVLEIHDQIVSEVLKGYEEQAMAITLEEMRRQMPFLSDALPLDADCGVKERLGDGL